jgi:hypothetical protein
LEQESKDAKELSATATTSLQNWVAELEGRLAAEQERNRQLLQAKENAAKTFEATLEALHLDIETLASTKEDLQLSFATGTLNWLKHRRRRAS